jgi:hypothetical protein
MPSLARRTRVILGLVVLLAALAAWQGAAVAAWNATGATIEGKASTTSPPGGVLKAKVTATGSGPWDATSVAFGSLRPDCVNHGDGGASSKEFNITAPGPPGEYDVGFRPNEADNCKGTAGGRYDLQGGLRVTAPTPNPDLPPRCGIDVMR